MERFVSNRLAQLPLTNFQVTPETLIWVAGEKDGKKDDRAIPIRSLLDLLEEAGISDEYTLFDQSPSVSAPTSGMIYGEEITGTGTSFALSQAPNSVSEVGLFFNGVRLEYVVAAPDSSQFIISAAGAITLGLSKTSEDRMYADYLIGLSSEIVVGEKLTGTGTAFTLANTPASASSVALFFNGLRMELVTAPPGTMQFSMSAANVTLGDTKAAADVVFADYQK